MKTANYKGRFLNITEVRVNDLEESIEASGLPMLKDFNGEFKYDQDRVIKAIEGRCSSLGGCANGEGHDNFLKGITVSFNILYPVFWTPQLQRYHFIDIVSSQSTMHRITKMDLNEVHSENVSKRSVRYLERLVDIYNSMLIKKPESVIVVFNEDNEVDKVFDAKDVDAYNQYSDDNFSLFVCEGYVAKSMPLGEFYHIIIENIPQGQLKWMRCTTNYLQLKSIVTQREGHKLFEWAEFVEWAKSLPFFEELTKKVFKSTEEVK